MNKKEIAQKLLDSLKMLEIISNIVYSDYHATTDYDMIIAVNGFDKTVSKYNYNSVTEILFSELQKVFEVNEPVEIFDKAREPIFDSLNSLLGNDDEDKYFDFGYLERLINEL